ncbi:MAG: hypothetical protein QXR45_09560 [Candidatus Bathyarchaeia archaeon]
MSSLMAHIKKHTPSIVARGPILPCVQIFREGRTGLRGSTIILMGCNGTGSDHVIKKAFLRGV